MNKSNVDISSIVKITTSLKEVLQKQKPHWQFRIHEQMLFKQFFGENGDMIEPIIELYVQAISQLNSNPPSRTTQTTTPTTTPTPGAAPTDEAKIFVENMNTILSYFAASQTNPELQQYKNEIETVKSVVDTHVSEILKTNYIRGLSPEGIKSIQDLMYIWVQFDHSMKHVSELLTFELTMIYNRTPLEARIIYRSFRTFMELYADMAKSYGQKYFGGTYNPDGNSEKQEIIDGTLAYRKEWIDHTIIKLSDPSYNFDDIWGDDVVNGILQMINQKVINLQDLEARKTNDADRMRRAKQAFLSRFDIESKVSDAYKMMELIARKYKSTPIQDDKAIETFAAAYRLVYMYEMVTDKQKPFDLLPKTNLRDYSLFILMQSESFLDYGEEKWDPKRVIKFDPKIHIKRAIQDINIKESTIQFNRAFSKRIRNCILTCEDTDSSYSFNRMGHSYAPSQVVLISAPDKSSEDPAKDIVTTAYHEQSHILSGNKILSETATDYRSYNHYEQMLTKAILGRNVDVKSDEDLYEEVKADIAGIHGYMRALIKFPIGRTPEELKKEISALKNEAEKKLMQKTGSPLLIFKDKKWIKYPPVLAYDQIAFYVLNTRKNKDIFEKILSFEYKKDGKPKTLKEIIDDQQYELDQTRNYSSRMIKFEYGPSRNMDRIKFRMMLMMRRAIAFHKEEECIDLINEFLQHNKTFFEKMGDDVFAKGFPDLKFPTQSQARACIRGFIRRGWEQDFENAEFMVGAYKLVRSLDEKNKTTNKNQHGPKDNPDGQTQ